jgi:hypothetical protein
MHAPLPSIALEPRQIGIARDCDELLALLLARKAEVAVSDEWIDAACLSSGHLSKLVKGERNLGRQSLDGLLLVLGCSLVLIEDPQRAEMMRADWAASPREASKVHPPTRRAGRAAIDRARRNILRELSTLTARVCR